MGCSRIAVLKIEERNNNVKECGLWTRGGLEGVEVHIENKVVAIPKELIMRLISSHYVSEQISKYEQMETDEVIEEMMNKRA